MAKKISVEMIGKPKVKIRLAEGEVRKWLYGERVQFDEEGRGFVIVEARPDVIQYTRDLHPDWEMSEPFYEIPETIDAPEVDLPEEDTKDEKKKAKRGKE